MSIDKTVGAITEALEVLAAELKEARIAQEKHNLLLQEMLEKAGGAAAKPARKTRTRKAKAAPKDEPEAADESEAKPARKTRTRKKKEAEPEKPETTVADVTAMAAKWLSDTGEDKELRAARRAAIKEICQDLGVTRISMIPEEDASKAMELLQAAIDGEAAADDDEDDLL